MTAALRLVECRAILGGERDPLRSVWDMQATAKDRRLLLAMAGRIGEAARYEAMRPWCELPEKARLDIAVGLRKWRKWSELLK